MNIGSGTYSTVVKDKYGDCVIKTFRDRNSKFAIREIALLKFMSCEYIIKPTNILIDDDGYFKIYMKKYTFDLKDARKKFMLIKIPSEQIATLVMKIIYQLVTATNYLHSSNIIHCDLKPANILFDAQTKNICVCDFNISLYGLSGDKPVDSRLQTAYYRAPEININSPTKITYATPKMDVWSIGCIIYEFICGFQLFGSNDDTTISVCNLFNLPTFDCVPNERLKRLKVLRMLNENQIMKTITTQLNASVYTSTHETIWSSWQNFIGLDYHDQSFKLSYVIVIYKLMAWCLTPNLRQRKTSQQLLTTLDLFNETLKTKFDITKTHQFLPPSRTDGFGSIILDASKDFTTDVPDAEDALDNKLRESKLLKSLSDQNKIWVISLEVNYYRKLSSKKLWGTTESLKNLAACIYIIGSISEECETTLTQYSDELTSKDIEDNIMNIIKTLNYDLIL
jgi:serine/threonine protein kinase